MLYTNKFYSMQVTSYSDVYKIHGQKMKQTQLHKVNSLSAVLNTFVLSSP